MNPGTHQTPVTGKQRHGSLPILRSSLPLSKPPNPKSSPSVMSKKRSRVGQSQSFGDITLLNQQHSLELRWDPATPVNIPDQSRSNILRVSAPPLMYEMESRNRDCFLKRCYHCKKRLDQSKNIYMYGDSAFCTHECREAQIAIDKATAKTDTRTVGRETNR